MCRGDSYTNQHTERRKGLVPQRKTGGLLVVEGVMDVGRATPPASITPALVTGPRSLRQLRIRVTRTQTPSIVLLCPARGQP